jgi:hypothetical protein
MIRIAITDKMLAQANSLYHFRNLPGSITAGKSQIYGAIGEVMVMHHFKGKEILFEPTFDYDMIIDGHKIDVKTKKTTVVPMPDYFCSISCHNTKQKCDYYFFTRVMEDKTEGFLLGYIGKDDFYKKAQKKNKGDLDVNGFVFKDDCYNLMVKDLHQFKYATNS